MVHRASERAESDSDVGDNPADMKMSNSASDEDAEDAVATHQRQGRLLTSLRAS